MKSAKVRLSLTAALFVAWIGWLVYLAATTTRPVVLSRPQFLAADLYAIARLRAGVDEDTPAAEAKVREVLWSKFKDAVEDTQLVVVNLPQCGRGHGWIGPGEYVLALSRIPEKDRVVYRVTATPRSPGYYPAHLETSIYPATPETRRQLETIRDAYHPK